jgi:hypothetical protein
MQFIMRRYIARTAACLIAALLLICPTMGADQKTPIPDFSGVWAHPFLTGFEPPASGPGPVTNRSRRRDGVANFQRLVGD